MLERIDHWADDWAERNVTGPVSFVVYLVAIPGTVIMGLAVLAHTMICTL